MPGREMVMYKKESKLVLSVAWFFYRVNYRIRQFKSMFKNGSPSK
jgi:hypothetical protein